MLAAFDALGELCKQDEDITARIVAEARPPQTGVWHRETHAFVAVARRAPARAAPLMEAFVRHPLWWVRAYAARAAAAAGDVARLETLAYDANDNRPEAPPGPLRRPQKSGADSALVAGPRP